MTRYNGRLGSLLGWAALIACAAGSTNGGPAAEASGVALGPDAGGPITAGASTQPAVAKEQPLASNEPVLRWPAPQFLPLNAKQFPSGLRAIRRPPFHEVEREFFDAACGDIDPERFALENIPEERVREVARALYLAEVTREVLVCRKALRERLGASQPSAITVTFEIAGSSHETVTFIQLPEFELPETARFVHDATKQSGLEKARCQYFELFPNKPCTELSNTIGRWPAEAAQGQTWWVLGRVVGLNELLAAQKGTQPHPRLADLNALLLCAGELEVSSLELRLASSTLDDTDQLVARSGPLTRHCQRYPDTAAAQHALELAQEPRAAQPTTTRKESCDSCAPLMRAAVIAERKAREKKRPHERTLRVDERFFIRESKEVADPDYQKADEALEAARDKRAALLAPILERWRAGQAPKPDDFKPINGSDYVKRLKKELSELGG